MNKEDFRKKANERFQKARTFWMNWRAQARDDYAFVSGDQWLPGDMAILEEQKRPPITFNYSEKMVDAVIGAEVGSRQETTYLPRGQEDRGLAELWNNAGKWVRQGCDAEDEESDAFRDCLICGLGWTWTRLDQEEDLDGKILVERVDPLELYSDPAAMKVGLRDRRWVDRLYWVDNDEVKRLWPNALPSIADENTSRGVVNRTNRYDDNEHDEQERHANQTQIRLHECYEFEPVYRVALGPEMHDLDEKSFNTVKDQLPEGSFVKQRRRVYYWGYFAGDTLLEMKKSPCQKGFTFNCITGKRDRNKNTWYGLTRVMKDPQRWANKWLSQILHIINTNAKGGIMAEINAVVDPVKFQDEWSKPDSVSWFKEGALSQKKVMQKQAAPYPTGLDKLMSFALESLPMVTGINLEALGLANREQAGVLEEQRKQAAFGLLSPMFDALRRYRKDQGRVTLYMINEYISDGRLVRIGGPESQQFMPLTKQQGALEYDVVVDQSPNAPDTKQKTWGALVEILPAMMKAQIPIPPEVLDYTPLPTSLANKWKEFIGQQQQVAQEMQQEMEGLQQENMQLKNDQQIKQQEIDMKKQEMEVELELEQQKAAAQIRMERETHRQKMQLEQEKAQANFQLESFKQDRQFELEGRRAQHEAGMKKQQLDNDFKVKAFTAGIKPDDAGKFQIDVNAGELPQLLNQVAQASQAMSQQAQQSQAQMMQALQRLTETLARPRQLVMDAQGRPVGSALQ